MTTTEAARLKPDRSFDRLLVLAWLLTAAAFTLGVGLRLAVHLESDFYTTLWESGPLVVAWRIVEGLPMYSSPTEPPSHLAIYGPLYYQILGRLGAWLSANRLMLITIGRSVSIFSLPPCFLSAFFIVRRSGAIWWACLLPWVSIGLLPPVAVRFCGSTRPDALAAAFSLTGIAFACWSLDPTVKKAKGWIHFRFFLGAAFLSAATLTKQSMVSAPIALGLALWSSGMARQGIIVLLCWLGLTLSALVGVQILSGGLLLSHWQAIAAAPTSWKYAWAILAEGTPGREVWVMLAWATILGLTSWKYLPFSSARVASENQEMTTCHAQVIWRVTYTYFWTSLGLNLLAGACQGSDQNYLIEPTLALGPVIGVWAARFGDRQTNACRVDTPRNRNSEMLLRLLALMMLFNPPILRLNDYLEWPKKAVEGENALNGYGVDAPRWFASLPGPVLSLDPWLAYLSGREVWISDPVTYAFIAVRPAPSQEGYSPMENLDNLYPHDGLAKGVRNGAFQTVVIPFPLENAQGTVHRDLTQLWPSMRNALERDFHLVETCDRWYRYELNPVRKPYSWQKP